MVIVGDKVIHETAEVFGAWVACIPCHYMVEDAVRLENDGKDTKEAVSQMAYRCQGRWNRRTNADDGQKEAFYAAAVETINGYLQHRTGTPIRHGGPAPQHG